MEKDLQNISQELREFSESLGAELYGVASAQEYEEKFRDKPGPRRFISNAQSIIIIGLPFEPGTVATVLKPELANLRTKAAEQVAANSVKPIGSERYFLGDENGIIINELGLMGYKIAKFLRHNGWTALHLPACKQNDRFRTAPFYHMPAMYLAGMGTLGLNCSILTKEFGPRIFVTSIITDCPLEHGQPMKEELCTKCNLCEKTCPIQAIDGKGWKNPYACASYGCCSTCLAICPVGEI